jgi:hypothetical protein
VNVTGGDINVTTYFALRLTADGTAATALTITNFDLQYVRSGVAPTAKVDATALSATDSAHGDNQAIEIDATDQPGLYRVDWPDAAFAVGVKEVVLTVKVATTFAEHLAVQIDSPVNMTSIEADLQSATDLKDFADSGYDPATNKVQGVVLVDTTTTNTDVRGTDSAALASVCTEGRLAELDAAKLPADVDTLLARLTAARAALLDEITAVRMAVLTDWINGGRLDLLLDAIPTTAMRGTDSAALATNVPDSLSHANLIAQLITAYHLDHLFQTTYDPASKPGAADALFNELIENDGGVSRLTANALEQAPTSGSGSTVNITTEGTHIESDS